MSNEGDKEDVLTDASIIDEFVEFFGEYRYDISALNAVTKTISVRLIDLIDSGLSHYFLNNKKVEFHLKLLSKAVQQAYENFHPEIRGDDTFPLQELEARLIVDDPALVIKMGRINISNRKKLTVFDSIIVSKSEIKNTIKEKHFRCNNCARVYPTKVGRCEQSECGLKTIVMSADESIWSDCEFLELQERQDDLASSATVPVRINARIFGDLVGKYKAGDNVRVTGIIKMQKTVSDSQINRADDDEFTTDVLFDRVCEIHNLELLATSENAIINDPQKYLTPDDVSNVLKLRKKYEDDDELMDVLNNSFAPHVYGHTMVKESVLLQNVGGLEIVRGDQKSRKNINILLVGDPGTQKTKILEAAMKLSINGHMASGKGASGVGLTAAVERDGDLHKLRIGAVPLAHKGHISIDEFSNISADDKSYLLDCMESGTFRVNKAGINTLVNADANFLVATNPDSGKYNRFNTLFDNLTISGPMFSRFHIVFVMPDIVNKEEDSKMALHIMSTYDPSVVSKHPLTKKEATKKAKARISNDLLFRYLLYAQTHNTGEIRIDQDAMEILLEFYNNIRAPEKDSDITATPRQFDGMLKLAFARTRLMLRDVVTAKIAQATTELLRKSFYSCGMVINSTGGLNLTAEYSQPLSKINKNKAFTMVVRNLTQKHKRGVTKNEILDELRVEAKMGIDDATELFDKHYDGNKLLRDKDGYYVLTD